jgi:hypothetical protein
VETGATREKEGSEQTLLDSWRILLVGPGCGK